MVWLKASVYVLLEPFGQVSWIQCTATRSSTYGDSNTTVRKTELSWFHFPLEKPQVIRQRICNCERSKNRSCFLEKHNLHVALANMHVENVLKKKKKNCEMAQYNYITTRCELL